MAICAAGWGALVSLAVNRCAGLVGRLGALRCGVESADSRELRVIHVSELDLEDLDAAFPLTQSKSQKFLRFSVGVWHIFGRTGR